MNLMLSAQALGLVRNQQFSIHNKFYHFIGLRYSEVTEQQICLLDLRMNWSNIEKWRNLLKIVTIVLSFILKYCAKFKKIWSRNFKVITF
jgi:hypothetical protein